MRRYYIASMLLTVLHSVVFAQDSSHVLKKITVHGLKKKNTFSNLIPAQSLNKQTLQQINAPSVADAARFFSGVQVKDYGGAGGLKTISVRSLGASNTGIMYDGAPVADMQSGQIDLGRYSSTFINSMDLFQANMPGESMPARSFSSASILSINTQAFDPAVTDRQTSWQAGVRSGSFNYWQALAGVRFVLPSNVVVSGNIEGVSSKGDYSFEIINGNLTEKTKRNNGSIRSIQGELNVTKQFNDSSILQIKGWTYDSKRGLPGAIIFFNNRSEQQLWDQDKTVQARYKKIITSTTSMVLLGKFNNTVTRYRDPDFLNSTGGLDDRYRQSEYYASAAIDRSITRYLYAGFASDVAYSTLKSDKNNFATPSRTSTWNNLALNYSDSLWKWNGSLLWSRFSDQAKQGTVTGTKNKLTPTVAVSRRWSYTSPFQFRAFYKQVFRMPTFNDLYYNFIGNTNLRPEFSRQYNAGLTYSKSFTKKVQRFSISADAYYNQVKDKIIAVPAQNLFSWTMLNLGEVKIKGLDITAEANGSVFSKISWFARLAYTWQHALDYTDPSGSKYKNRIPYTPDHSGSGILSLQYRQWTAGYNLTFSGTRYTLGENNASNQLDGWGVHDVFVSRLVHLQHFNAVVKAEINNISNEHYDVIRYYPMPGRSFKMSLLFNNL